MEVGDSGPGSRDPTFTSLLVCDRGLREKPDQQVSRETQGSWYEQRTLLEFKRSESFPPTEIMRMHLSYRVFLVLRA